MTSNLTVAGVTDNTTYQYDDAGRLISAHGQQDGVPTITTYAYNAEGLLTSVTTEGVMSIVHSYNANKQLIRDSVYTIGQDPVFWSVTEYSYNTSGQLIQTDARSSSDDDTTVTFNYPNPLTRNFSSMVTTSGGISQTSLVEYDSHLVREEITWILSPYKTDNFIKTITWDLGTTTYTLQFSYDFNAHGYPTRIQSESTIGLAYLQTLTYTCQ